MENLTAASGVQDKSRQFMEKLASLRLGLSHDNCPHWIQEELEGGVKCIKEMVPQVIIFINM